MCMSLVYKQTLKMKKKKKSSIKNTIGENIHMAIIHPTQYSKKKKSFIQLEWVHT